MVAEVEVHVMLLSLFERGRYVMVVPAHLLVNWIFEVDRGYCIIGLERIQVTQSSEDRESEWDSISRNLEIGKGVFAPQLF